MVPWFECKYLVIKCDFKSYCLYNKNVLANIRQV